jgi:catechol 2,3-dioxygenase-like lactoylglutathione lyase family enzyme
MIKGIGHTAYFVENMEASLHFYCEVLGLKKAFEFPRDDGSPWIIYIQVCPGQFIELFYGGENKNTQPPKSIGYHHLCLEVTDIHAVANHLKGHGVKLDTEPRQGKDTNGQCWACDPDGNRIEFMQIIPGSPQSR